MTNLPYGADTIVIPFTIVPAANSQSAQPSRSPSPASPDSGQNAGTPDQATMTSPAS